MAALNLGGRESSWFHDQNKSATERLLTKMVKQGKLPQSALDAFYGAAEDKVPTTLVNTRPSAEVVPQYIKSRFPVPRGASNVLNQVRPALNSVSLGRARWANADGSIFSVADGARLAQEPVKTPSAWEAARLNRVSRAQLETPTLQGMRLLPTFTPGRALMWGSILALWGTAALVASSSRALGIRQIDEAEGKLRAMVQPYATVLSDTITPLKERLAMPSLQQAQDPNSEFARLTHALRARLSER